MASLDFLVVGHVTIDLLPDGSTTVGGTATYAALTAKGLGCKTGLITSAGPEFDFERVVPGVQVHCIPASRTTTFENIYDAKGARKQWIRGVAHPIRINDLSPDWATPSVVLFGPLVDEIALDVIGQFPHSLTGVTPQGWMRAWDENGYVYTRPWVGAERVLSQVDVLMFSEEDVAYDEAQIQSYTKLARLAVVTRGANGATVYRGKWISHYPAYQATVVDPTGAGDVFAAAFLIRLHETGDVSEAARFANCAASFAIEGWGTSNIPTRAQVEERLRKGALRT